MSQNKEVELPTTLILDHLLVRFCQLLMVTGGLGCSYNLLLGKSVTTCMRDALLELSHRNWLQAVSVAVVHVVGRRQGCGSDHVVVVTTTKLSLRKVTQVRFISGKECRELYLLILMLLASYGSTRHRSCREPPGRILQSVSDPSSKPAQGENNN